MAEYRDHAAELAAVDAEVVAVSVDPPSKSARIREQLGLPFVLLGDPTREVVEAWGLLNRWEHGGIAYPAVFVLDRDRTVRYRSLDRLASRVSAEAVVAFLRGGVPTESPVRTGLWPGLQGFWQAALNGLQMGFRSPRGR